MVAARDVVDHPALAVETHKNKRITPVDIGLPDALQNQSERRRTGATTEYISLNGQAAPALENAPMAVLARF